MQDNIILKYPHLYRRQGFLIKAYNVEAAVFSCSIEQLFWKKSQNSQKSSSLVTLL